MPDQSKVRSSLDLSISTEDDKLSASKRLQQCCFLEGTVQYSYHLQVTLPKYVRKAEHTFLLATLLKIMILASVFPMPLIFKPLGDLLAVFLSTTLLLWQQIS